MCEDKNAMDEFSTIFAIIVIRNEPK